MRRIGGPQDEHCLRMAELARDRLHRNGVEVFGVEDNRERVAGEAARGEHVEGDETAAHGGLLHTISG